MKRLLSILLVFISLSTFSQTYDTLPTGSKPYGNQLYITPTGLIIGGTGSAKFRVLGTKKYVDSLLDLKQDVLTFSNGLTKTGSNVSADLSYLNGRYVQIDPTTKQSGGINIDGGINVGLNTYLGNLSLSSLYLNIDDGRGNKIANFGGYGGSVGLGGSSFINQSTYISDRLSNPSSNNARSLFDVKGLITTDGITTTQPIKGTELFAVSDPMDYIQSGNLGISAIQNNNTGTPQSASFNINGSGRFDSPTSSTLLGPGLGNFATGTGLTSINGGNVNVGTELLTPSLSTSDSTNKAANTKFVKQLLKNYASLDVNGKVPIGQMPDALVGAVVYQGNYDASNNTPTLPTATGNKGKYYVVSVAGTQQGLNFENGDWIISNGTIWQKVDNSTKVASVNGMTGAVNITDITGNAGSANNWGSSQADFTSPATGTLNWIAGFDQSAAKVRPFFDYQVKSFLGVNENNSSNTIVQRGSGGEIYGGTIFGDNIQSSSLVGTGDRSIVADPTGVLKITSTPYAKLTGGNTFSGTQTFNNDNIHSNSYDYYNPGSGTYPYARVGQGGLYTYKSGTEQMVFDSQNQVITWGKQGNFISLRPPNNLTAFRDIYLPNLDGTVALAPVIGASAPTPTSTGEKGQVIITGGYRYECTSTNTWVRSALETSW
ncbi:MAG: hypothetical protein J7577_00905 [Sphingobacteriaceae bacterium]|nr:hypothetical protein [Sphingobacteriaceae bacterium]